MTIRRVLRQTLRHGASLACAALALAGGCSDATAPDRATRPPAPATADAPPAPTADSAWRFVDVSAESGIRGAATPQPPPKYIPDAKGGGVALFDYDGDGVLDIAIAQPSCVDRERRGDHGDGLRLWRGSGDLRFTDATAASGLPQAGWFSAPVAADLNGDGHADLLLTGIHGLQLWLGDGARFSDRSATALPGGGAGAGWCTSAVCADLDLDGDLDIFVARYLVFDLTNPPVDGADGRACRWKGRPAMCGPRGLPALPDLALRNRGDGTFEDATAAWGFDAVIPAYGLGVVALDFDNDGRPDVFVANDATPNHLWHNDGPRFSEVGVAMGVAYSADGVPEAGMGVDAADLNGDGIEDLVVTNFEGEPNDIYLSTPRAGYFESSARVHTAAVDRPHLGWGVAIRDFDGDGLPDILVANGHVYPDAAAFGTEASYAQPLVLHRGVAGGTFARLTGPAAAALDVPAVCRALAVGDLDNDGDLDVVITRLDGPPRVLRNDARAGGCWVGIVVDGPPGNRAGLGTRLTLRAAGGMTLRATVRAQSSFEATSDARVIFRLPAPTTEVSVDADLPAAPRVHRVVPACNRYVHVAVGKS